MKVNLRRNTADKLVRPTTSISNNTSLSIEDFRLYIITLEGLFKEALNENLKLNIQKENYI